MGTTIRAEGGMWSLLPTMDDIVFDKKLKEGAHFLIKKTHIFKIKSYFTHKVFINKDMLDRFISGTQLWH